MKISNAVLDILSNCRTVGTLLTLPEQLDRKLYEHTNKVIEAAGGKWNRKAKAHVFPGDAADAMDQIILTGEVTTPQDFGYFPTPERIVEQMIGMAELLMGMDILEPSAGKGAIANQLQQSGYYVVCVELLKDNADYLKKNKQPNVLCGDFLQLPPRRIFDRVIMNPPFSRQADIHHVNHAIKFLKPGGILVSVMSAGVMFRTNRLTIDFKNMVDAHDGEIIPLPEGSFRESGTDVNTVIVKMVAASTEGRKTWH